MLQHITDADMVVFNRATEETRQLIRDRNVRSMTRRRRSTSRTTTERARITARVCRRPMTWTPRSSRLRIISSASSIWMRPKTRRTTTARPCGLRVTSTAAGNIGKDEYVPGRMGMVCCAEDVRFGRLHCQGERLPIPQPKTWQMITAEVKAEERTQYKGVGPVLYVTKLEPCEPPKEEVVTFNQ